MRIPISWLREYVAFATPLPELAERLAVASAEVERILRRGVPDEDGNLGRYVVGRVLEAGKHPNADRLQLCRVDVGDPEPRQIVCGAWNFGAGRDRARRAPRRRAPGRAHARAREAPRRRLGGDDPLRAGARDRHRPRRHPRPRRPARAGDAARRRAPDSRRGARGRADRQPAGPDLDLRDGARGGRARRRRAGAAPGHRPAARRRRAASSSRSTTSRAARATSGACSAASVSGPRRPG